MKKRVLLGLSWWVDSAVAGYLLLQQGYEVIAGFMKNYADESNPNCHTREDRDMAIKVAQHLGITTFIIFDFREQYDEKIIRYITSTYEQWRTPNPDVLCNSEIKFKLFLEEGEKLWCDFVATGHYARITAPRNWLIDPNYSQQKNSSSHNESADINNASHKITRAKNSLSLTTTHNFYHLLKGIDSNKDQSYFLAWLNQGQLSKSLFPLGEMTKPQVRELAERIDLPNAERKDSQWLCFIGKVDMKEFLQQSLPIKKWTIKNIEGVILGEHDGVHFYTIGQRQGLGLSGGPRYVVKRDLVMNELIVGPEDTTLLYSDSLIATDRHRVAGEKEFPLSANAKIRYRQEDQAVTISIDTNDKANYLLTFDEPQRAISSGQTVAIYDEDELIASGIIQ